MTEHNNPPAFPTKQPLSSDFLGLTMLDHFAGMAMQVCMGTIAQHAKTWQRRPTKWQMPC